MSSSPHNENEADYISPPMDAIVEDRPPRLGFAVVGIGGSAGGLESFIEFFKVMPSNTGMAFVIIQHLPPDRDSLMAEILAKHTKMQVLQVEDGLEVLPDHVYVIRPGHTLTIRNGRLKLGHPVEHPGHRRPVDDFFRSLADEQRERAICIIMSGMGSNGTAGVEIVKAVGGVCIAQVPESAKFPSMPRHMIDAGVADFVLRPKEIPDVLIRYSTHPYAKGIHLDADAAQRAQDLLHEVLSIVRSRTRHDFHDYKDATLVRRIERRMGLSQVLTMGDYAAMLAKSPSEAALLAQDMMIHVTGFFRDSDAWDAMRDQVIKPLIAGRPTHQPIRAWVTACSTGEEAFTLAILLVEEAEAREKHFDIKIFATDTGESSLTQARAGLYPGGIESEISPQRLERFFDREDASYRVKKELRELVVFAPQNLLEDPPFSKLDICTCRNLLIYLKPDVQKRVLWLLHFGLREGGALMLGSSEMTSDDEGLFIAIDKKCRIYRRIGPTRHGLMDFPHRHPLRGEDSGDDSQTPAQRSLARSSVSQTAQRALLERFTAPAVVVDRQHRIVFYHGDTGWFLDHPQGEPTQDLLANVREVLRGVTRSALQSVTATNRPTTIADAVVGENGDRFRVEVTAAPLERTAANPPHIIISFDRRPEIAVVPRDAAEQYHLDQTRLEDELRRAQHELQSTVEELQTSNEEMKASNEEITSVNEELQSTNEELETSKEELQSLNEELATVNLQLQTKMEELQETTSDLSSLLSSTDIAVLFLDTRFRIRRFTPAAKDLFDMIPADLGRPLSDLSQKFEDAELLNDSATVLEKLVPVEKEIASSSGKTYLRRILPYRTRKNQIDGVVITFVDITRRKKAEASLMESEELYRLIVQGVNEYAIISFDPQGQINLWNAGAERVLGYSRDDVLWKSATMILTPEDRDAGIWESQLDRVRELGELWDERWHVRKDGSHFWASGILSAVHHRDGRLYGFVKILRDNTDRKRAETLRQAKDTAESANAAKDRFLANVSHELRTPLAATLLWANMLQESGTASPTELREGLEVIRRSAEAQKELIEDLLDTSRITAGELRLELRPIALADLTRSAVEAILPSAVAKGVTLQTHLDPEVGVVLADPHRMQQVIWNLVSNAAKFTNVHGLVEVTLKRIGEWVEIRVSDNGRGISPEFLPHVFERFRQGDVSSTRLNPGLGLGLAIAKNLVELHGGEITVQSDGEGRGSTFTVRLPLPRQAVAAESTTRSVVDAIALLRGKHVLVVEDVEATRNAISVLLSRIGVVVVAAATAAQAIEQYKLATPDLIISDLGMPMMDGYALIRQIRELEAEQKSAVVPALALTAYDATPAQSRAIESGFQQFLTKPTEPQQLIGALVALLRS